MKNIILAIVLQLLLCAVFPALSLWFLGLWILGGIGIIAEKAKLIN